MSQRLVEKYLFLSQHWGSPLAVLVSTVLTWYCALILLGTQINLCPDQCGSGVAGNQASDCLVSERLCINTL